jgi:hypothetical protein
MRNGVSIDSVKCLNENQEEAPSTRAASKGAAGSERSPARRRSAMKGVKIHTSIITTVNIAYFTDPAHGKFLKDGAIRLKK